MRRYTIDLTPEFDELLSQLAKENSTTKSEIIRRAIASYEYLKEHADSKRGRKVSITDQEDRVLKDVVLP